MTHFSRAALVLSGVLLAFTAQAQDVARPTVDDNGTVRGTIPEVPVSDFLSPEARAQFADRLKTAAPSRANAGIETIRKFSDETAKGQLDAWLKIHPATITPTMIDGVQTHVVVPQGGVDPKNKKRVLINAHMGGFFTGGRYGGQLEAVPLAGRGRVQVIAVDYRMAPEFKFPAASEDMEAVYRHVLKTTKPENIGIYGCSAGGTLVAQSMAWFQQKNLPKPGAIGIFCSGAMPSFWFGGDSGVVTPLMNGNAPLNRASNAAGAAFGYFDGVDANTAIVTPGLFPAVLAKFPPTLVVTGTRDVAMSNALITHTRLLQAGVKAELFVQEGLGHGHFFGFPGTAESATAYDVIWGFFDRNLKR